ncbi:NADH-quinone oxidoreductase subunit A [Buchnera aphidicola (Neophyllaphis varicolor)]|uniref:NADH-quinone oxidoreductase subunit A n=1 Tax=Buchnera aphidicola TaxID=9 RepID=UPI0031B7F82A
MYIINKDELLNFFIFFLFSLSFCFLMLLAGYFLGGKSYSRYKNVPFESGISSFGSSKIRFAVKFYLIAMFFIIFDIETMYLYVWAVSVKEIGIFGFFEVCFFVFVILISLLYLVKNQALNWTPTSNSESLTE